MSEHIPSVAECIEYSRNFANSKPDIGSTEREHILGLCAALERQRATMAELIEAAQRALDKGWEYGDDEPHFVRLNAAIARCGGAS